MSATIEGGCDRARGGDRAEVHAEDRRFVGTIDYVPPAQIEGGTVDCGADVYSLSTCSTEACLPTSAYAVYLSLKSTASTWMSVTLIEIVYFPALFAFVWRL